MATKLKSAKRRTKVQDIPKKAKAMSGKEQKKVKGGLLPYLEQDNLKKPTTISSITDGTSNTVITK